MRRWTFWSANTRAWTGNLCDPHAPWDDRRNHLKPMALRRYLAAFPTYLPDGVRVVGWDPSVGIEPCLVCQHEARQAELRSTLSEMYEE